MGGGGGVGGGGVVEGDGSASTAIIQFYKGRSVSGKMLGSVAMVTTPFNYHVHGEFY